MWKLNHVVALWDVNMASAGNLCVHLYWQACVFHVWLSSFILLATQRAHTHLKQAMELTRRGDRALLIVHFFCPSCSTKRSVLHVLCTSDPHVLGWRAKGSSDMDMDNKTEERKTVWAVLKVAGCLGCNIDQVSCNHDESTVLLIQAICYRFKAFQILPTPFIILMQNEQCK